MPDTLSALLPFHPITREWFSSTFQAPTRAQEASWAAIARGESSLVLAPTGSGKTLAAFLWCIDRIMFSAQPSPERRCRVVYVSPLKALAVDIERNLRVPIAGLTALATERGVVHQVLTIGVRTGDTPARERAQFRRQPPDILITTPESLYLVLTARSREGLRNVETLIIDEIHALVPTKRGAHLALSVARLAAESDRPTQRIGLSATQRPLDEVARFLGGPEPVTIVDAGERKRLELRIEVPLEDRTEPTPTAPKQPGSGKASVWTAIYPRLLELVRAHRSTLMFVNGRRSAERIAGALNELAGDTLVRAHHGSLARAQRGEVEEALKAGTLRGLVATSSLELGIDMGAIDLVVQIEAPPSVASGLQRIGRAGHQVNAVSRGVLVPKYRGDLVACAAVTRAMHEGAVEATRYPRNPLDVLAQQLVAMTSVRGWNVDDLFSFVRRAAPFADLTRGMFENVLDMLSGRYPSDEFAELRPRVTWDRIGGTIVAREGAQRVAIINGGAIPDRGLYGVFLAGAEGAHARVGELDEEMVFESRIGDTFLLGASTWRIEEMTHDRVLVSPAPGEPGKMPFWRGDAAPRPIEFGRRIGALVRDITALPPAAAITRLTRDHDLDPQAAESVVRYLGDQQRATSRVPDDTNVVIERYRDDLGDWRLCLLSPLGGQVLAPWSLAIAAHARDRLGIDVETLWADDGIVVRVPESNDPPDTSLLLPASETVETLVVRQLASSHLFAAKFRECAARALLLPKRRPGGRTPLWHQRKRAADLLAVAAQFGSFPIVLEAYRECLRDVFDMPALVETMRAIESRRLDVTTVESEKPSPFASALLFGYVANYIYDGDAPLSERRAHALAIDQSQLSELLGGIELRELLDLEAMLDVERELQGLAEPGWVRTADAVHDLLLRVGDLSRDEVEARAAPGLAAGALDELVRTGRTIEVTIAGALRLVAAEDAARVRDALGVRVPEGVPASLLGPVADPLRDLVRRYARTHAPFAADACAARLGISVSRVTSVLLALADAGTVLEGAFRPDHSGLEWCDAAVLGGIRRRSLASVRHAVAPVEPAALGRLFTTWQGVARRRVGPEAVLDAVESLQAAPLPASLLETEILPARVDGYRPGDLDALIAAGEVTWTGVEPLGERDGRVALFLTDHRRILWRPRDEASASQSAPHDREARILEALQQGGALFFADLHERVGGGYPGETVDALWALVWRGAVTNDSLQALRAFVAPPERRRGPSAAHVPVRARRSVPPEGAGRWSAWAPIREGVSPTDWSLATAQQLLTRYGLVTRDAAAAEALPGGFSAIYDVLRTMDERGRVRRGYFVSGIAATQFATPAALDMLRALRHVTDEANAVLLAATDPANPYGTFLKWPTRAQDQATTGRAPTRSVGASVLLVDGALAAYLGRGQRQLLTFLPEDEPERSRVGAAVARLLAGVAGRSGGLLIAELDGDAPFSHPLAPFLQAAGFVRSHSGYQLLRPSRRASMEPDPTGARSQDATEPGGSRA